MSSGVTEKKLPSFSIHCTYYHRSAHSEFPWDKLPDCSRNSFVDFSVEAKIFTVEFFLAIMYKARTAFLWVAILLSIQQDVAIKGDRRKRRGIRPLHFYVCSMYGYVYRMRSGVIAVRPICGILSYNLGERRFWSFLFTGARSSAKIQFCLRFIK